MFNFFLLIKNGKIKKKKIIIGIIIGVPLITSAIVIPIVFIKKDNDEENNDKKVIEEIIKILKNKELNEKTLILEGNSTGKIIENNKDKIIAKIKELINDSKLEEILIEVSIKNDVNISRILQPIIVTIKKNKYSKKIEGENGLKVKRKINILETKINNIKTYLETQNNLNILLPKTNYDSDDRVLESIKVKLINNIEGISNSDSHLIIKKVGSSTVNEVAAHGQASTQYIITIDGEDFILNLNQEEFSLEEQDKIEIIKTHLETSSNLNLVLPKTTYDNDVSILETIKVKLVNNINDISSSDSNLIIKKVGSSEVNEVATHGQAPTQYEISVGEHEFNLNLNQEEFSKEEKDKIETIKTHLETSGNLNLALPKTTYDIDNVILEAIKVKLVNDIETISSGDSHLIVKKVGSSEVNEVATHGQAPTQYEISVGEHEFNLNLNQEEFSKEEKDKIETIKTHLETSGNLNLVLPKMNYNVDFVNPDKVILSVIKLLITENIKVISNDDFYLIIKKEGSKKVNEVAAHGQASTQYIITIGKHEFTLNLNQEKFSLEEQDKIEIIKTHLETSGNLNLVLPKTNYDSDDSILKSIKVKLVNDINDISSSDSHLIVKKIGSSIVNEIATHDEAPTQYEISVGEHEFTLNLKQKKFSLEEQDKIETIKTHLETLGNLNLALPKTTYDNDVSILEAIKLKLVNDINDISSSDSNLIIKKVGSSEVNEVATHGQAPTQYIITIGEHEFNLNLNQEEFSEEEKVINIIKKYLKNADNLNLILPKNTYDNDVSILEAVRLKLINNIEGISSSNSHLIIKKVGSSEVNEVAAHGQASTQYEISIGEHEFNLNLNQEEFSEEEKVNKIKTYLKTSSNLNLILPKTTYDNDVSILETIKVKLVNDINDISSSDSNLIIKKVGSSEVTLVATHSEAPTQYIITIDDEDFTLNLNQEEFSKEEKNKIKIIKTHLETLGNLNLILPKTTYDIDNVILEAIKVKLVNDIDDISSSDSHLIIKKVGSNEVNEVAAHGQALTQYEISVGEHEFTLNLNQEEFSEEEKIINIIKKYLENVGNLNLALPKTTYDNDVSILEAIKVKLVNDINDISNSDSHLIIKKVGSSEVNEVTTHGQAPTQYIITIDGEDFTLKLNQEEFSEEEKDKIKIIKKYLETPNNLNLILPKTNHSGDVEILDAIKLKLVNDIEGISSDDSYLIIKKIGSSVVNSIAFYNEKATPYEITIGKHEFTLNLNKEKYTLLEKKWIIRIHLIKNTNIIILPKTNYDSDDSILEAIKLKLVNDIKGISSSDSHLIIKKEDSSIVNEVAAHDATNLTQYIITFDKSVFVLNLHQEEFSKEEKMDKIKTYLETPNNLNLALPKTTYDNDDSILNAIKIKLVNNIEGISNSDSHLIIKKVGSSEVTLVATHSEAPTQYIITIDGKDFVLNLNQEDFSKEEKIDKIKTYLETPNNLNLALPKTTYDNDDSILNAIKIKLVNNIEGISNSDSHLIIKKEGSNKVNSIATHDEAPTQYIITIDGEDSTLNLNQEEFSKEEKRDHIYRWIDRKSNQDLLRISLPKTNYNSDAQILAAIWKKLGEIIPKVNENDVKLIIKKDEIFPWGKPVKSVATHSEEPTSYRIRIQVKEVTSYGYELKLNQEE